MECLNPECKKEFKEENNKRYCCIECKKRGYYLNHRKERRRYSKDYSNKKMYDICPICKVNKKYVNSKRCDECFRKCTAKMGYGRRKPTDIKNKE